MDKEAVVHTKEKEIMPFAAKWIDLEINTLTEVSHHMISLICGI